VKLHTKIAIGLVAGAVAGGVANALFAGAPWLNWVSQNVAYPVGQVFLRLLFMTVVPIVFTSITLGVAGIGDMKTLGRLGSRAMGYFGLSTLIAATIVFVGIENTTGWGSTRGRTLLVFVFGLLHGLGFASVLGDYGIASGRFVYALVGFNIGVEFGQLAVIAIAFALVGWFYSRPWYRKAIAIPASLVITAIGAYWVVERTLL